MTVLGPPPATLLLCAGYSRRMGRPKAWLRLGDEPLLVHIAKSAVAAGCTPLIVVVGTRQADGAQLVSVPEARAALAPGIPPAALRIVVGAPDATPIDSIRAGLGQLEAQQPLLLWPIDHPFATAQLVRRLIEAMGDAPQRVVLPTVRGKGAHPVLFGAAAARELLEPVADRGARAVVHADPRRLVTVPADDARLILAINTPAQASAAGLTLPTAGVGI